MTRPPLSAAVRWILGLLLPETDRRTLLSELEETYRLRVEREGEAAARAWLRREGRRALFHATRARLRFTLPARAPGFLRDLGHAARGLLCAPAFSLAVVLTVALGIGGTTAVFAVVHGVLVRPLPYPEPEELVQIYTAIPDQNWNFSMADADALLEQQTTFDEVAFISRGTATLETPDGAEQIRFRSATPSLFRLLGIAPTHGRGFTEADVAPEADTVAVVTWAFWKRRLGGDLSAVGRTVRLNGRPVPVVGVLPPEVDPLTDGFDLVTPLRITTPARKGPFSYLALGRVRPEMRDAASAELKAIEERIFPRWEASWPRPEVTWVMRDLKEHVVGDADRVLWVALSAVGFLLLIACANAANLLVARGLARRSELAMRNALGASRGQLLRHLLAESAVLALAGAGAALGLAVAGVQLVTSYGAPFIPRLAEVGLTGPVLLFFGAATLGALAVFGVVPALQATGSTVRDPASTLRAGGAGGSADPGARRLQQVLVGGQFAVAAPLLVGAGLLLVSLDQLRGVDPGFDAEHTLTAQLHLPPDRYPYADSAAVREAWERLANEIRELPGVAAAGLGTGRPPDRPAFGNNFVLEDRPLGEGEAQPATPWVVAEPGYFTTLGLDVVEGRMFDGERDPPRVALVDETWAGRFFPEGSAVGRRFRHGACTRPSCPAWTVLGVVEDVRYTGLDDPGEGTVYMNFRRWPDLTVFVIVRTVTDEPEALIPVLRRVVRGEGPGIAVSELATGVELLSGTLRQPRYLGSLVAAFAGLALVLALVGVYGTMAYFVQQRRMDIGIRLAVGGEPSSVAGLVLRAGVKLAAGGTALGMMLGLALSGFLESVLFGVQATDPVVFGAVTALLVGVAAAACWGPARRAARTDPAGTLREE